jgi:hypothetical protein
MKKWIIRLVVIILVAGIALAGVRFYKSMTIPQKTHYHAGFVVFANNKKVDFSSAKYMSVSPCTLKSNDDDDMSPGDIQREKAHLHDYVGDVVHVERTGAKWGDLFTNLHYPVDNSTATAYINGQRVQDFQNTPIRVEDSIVIFMGKNDMAHDLKQAVTKTHIREAAKKSEDCG